jgi:hypothetical protein
MPQIIDKSYNYTTSTSGTTIVLDVPNHSNGDVLFAMLTADTGTGTFSASGWTATTLFTTSTPAIHLLWRVASSEPANYTFTSTVSETFNGTMISVRDVDTTTPIGNVSSVARAGHSTAFPSVTATRNNSMILYMFTHPSISVTPSAIEGPVTQLIAKDGTAHADGIAWTIASGASPTTVISSVSNTTYGGILASVVIQPPSGGATYIPAYCAEDLSVFHAPIQTVGFRNTGPVTNASLALNYGTALSGRALAGATTANQTDKGINTYRSCLGVTSSTNRTWQGVSSAFGTPQALSGKNVLCHIMPNAPIEIQTMEAVGLGRGVAFGLHIDNSSNYYVWHVHGDGTPYGYNRAPVVINVDNTTGRIATSGTFNANAVAGFGLFTSGFVTSADFVWTMLWVLDTTTVCGGSSATPVDIPGIVRAASNGKERMSILQQGKNQMLVLQPLQLGNSTATSVIDISRASIEFPQQYDRTSAQVFYCSVDDVAGITFYQTANGSLDIRSTTFSSASKFHWRIASGTSTSATIYTTGAQVIGAGDVQLRYFDMGIDGMSFTGCTSNIAANSALLDNCTFSGCGPVVTDRPDRISNCSFTNTGQANGAIQITAAGTYTFSGNTFTGYNASNGQTDSAIVNKSTGLVTINITGGGDTPTYVNTNGGTTVINNSKTLTLTNLQTGSDIVILVAGTTTERVNVDAHGSTSYGFAYPYVASEYVDICVFKTGYVPFFIRNYMLQNASLSLPIAQVADRNFT